MLAAKIQVLDQILEEAEAKFPGVDEEWDPAFVRLIDEAD